MEGLSSRVVVLAAVLLLGAAGLWRQPARACSGPLPTCSRSVALGNYQLERPTNVQIFHWMSCEAWAAVPEGLPQPSLWTEAGVELPTEWEAMDGFYAGSERRAGPELPANTRIDLRATWSGYCIDQGGVTFDLDGDGVDEPDCATLDSRPTETILSFRTGAGPDLTPPERPAPRTYECVENLYEAREAQAPETNCGVGWPARTAGVEHYVRLPSLDRPPEVAELRTLWRRAEQTREEVVDNPEALPGPTWGTPVADRPGEWFVTTVAFDWAGNRSEYGPEVRLVFPEDCDFEFAYETEVKGCGCEASGPSGPGGVFTAASFLGLLLVAARRRRPAGRP